MKAACPLCGNGESDFKSEQRGVQRFAIANPMHWALRYEPQRISPSRTAHHRAAAPVDRTYRFFLSGIRRSDMLMCLARKPLQQRTMP